MRLALLLLMLAWSTGCVFVQTRTTALVVVAPEAGRVQFHHYEAVDTHLLTTTAVLCALTAVVYGGACWAYLAVPFDDQIAQARQLARADIARDVPCGRPVDWEIEVVGWLPEQRRFEIQRDGRGGRALTPDEIAALCRSPAPPSSSPPAEPAPLLDLDPAS